MKELYARYKDQGLVLIGVHTTNGGERMAEFAKEHEIPYPVAIDVEKATVTAFRVDSFPDYYLIDRAGKLRVADLANGDLDRAVRCCSPRRRQPAKVDLASLDAEKVLADALAGAKKTDRRLLIPCWRARMRLVRQARGVPRDEARRRRDVQGLHRSQDR